METNNDIRKNVHSESIELELGNNEDNGVKSGDVEDSGTDENRVISSSAIVVTKEVGDTILEETESKSSDKPEEETDKPEEESFVLDREDENSNSSVSGTNNGSSNDVPSTHDSIDKDTEISKNNEETFQNKQSDEGDFISLNIECVFSNPTSDCEGIDESRPDSLMSDEDRDFNKSEEDRLFESVQSYYPEIEFSKTVSDVIQEGKACIIKQSQNVFYNPVQEFNRDLSVTAISVFSEEHKKDPRCKSRGTKRKVIDEGENEENSENSSSSSMEPGVKYENGITILEALSATGLRSIRYAKEVPGVKEIVANDISVAAVESIKKNIEYNNVGNLISTSHNDASLLMYMRKAQGNFFDVIDLDPYGCPSRFLDAAVQSVRDGGLLLVTCTDMAVLAGNSPETCYVKYGAISVRNSACHEMALRIALQCIESHANRYGRYIIPQLSFSADFYIRVIVKVYTSPSMCKKTTSKLVMLYQCAGCQTLNYWPLGLSENCNNSIKYHLSRGPPVSQECPHCSSTYYQGGPIWSGPLHNTSFVEKMLLCLEDKDLYTEKRMKGMLELIREELVGSLLYHTIDSLCSKVHCEVVPRNKFVSAILHAGYKVTLSHAAPNSLKTNAPAGIIWDIIRCWVKDHPVNPKRLHPGSVAERLLSTMPRLNANFDLHPEVMPRHKRKLLRYQQNPQPFWGPGTRDKTNCPSRDKMKKSYTNQNKKYKRSSVERNRAHMKAVINSKNIDIIEVVTLSDDDVDGDDDKLIRQKIENSENKDNVEDDNLIYDEIKNVIIKDSSDGDFISEGKNIDNIKEEISDVDLVDKNTIKIKEEISDTVLDDNDKEEISNIQEDKMDVVESCNLKDDENSETKDNENNDEKLNETNIDDSDGKDCTTSSDNNNKANEGSKNENE